MHGCFNKYGYSGGHAPYLFFFNLILPTAWNNRPIQSHFADENKGSERLGHVPKVTRFLLDPPESCPSLICPLGHQLLELKAASWGTSKVNCMLTSLVRFYLNRFQHLKEIFFLSSPKAICMLLLEKGGGRGRERERNMDCRGWTAFGRAFALTLSGRNDQCMAPRRRLCPNRCWAIVCTSSMLSMQKLKTPSRGPEATGNRKGDTWRWVSDLTEAPRDPAVRPKHHTPLDRL